MAKPTMSSMPYPRFYLLEYFYVLLKSVERQSNRDQIFVLFKNLKEEYRLGESKYRRLTQDTKDLSQARLNRYHYTFGHVIDESKELGLVDDRDGNLLLSEEGRRLLALYDSKDVRPFNKRLFQLMEGKYSVFRTLLEFLYSTNTHKPGMLVFPSYSPRQLGIEKTMLKTTKDITEYSQKLAEKFEEDIRVHLKRDWSLAHNAQTVVQNLQKDKLLDSQPDSSFDPKRYNAIIGRTRDYWITVFLKEIYKSDVSWSTFERWVYRGKQIGIMHATEFYPNFNGKIVYPTSVVASSTESRDFQDIFNYSDGKRLYHHLPDWEQIQNKFVNFLVVSYFELRQSYKSRGRFISLSALRELVCYKMKISEFVFQEFLNSSYKLNLSGHLRIKISLEVDRLPEETKLMYLTQEPVMIDGKYRNIIYIDVTKEDNV